MKQVNILSICVVVLFCGCGTQPTRNSTIGSGPPSSPPSHAIGGNWQFSATSSVSSELPAAALTGSINQSGTSLIGTLHLDGWGCFDPRTAIGLSGAVTNGALSLTSVSIDGQVMTFDGRITEKIGFPDTFTGTYTVTGGCASGDRGSATGFSVASMTGNWAGNLTSNGGESIHWDTTLTQEGASSDGSFGLGGIVHFDNCFATGTITPGTLPDASFILGTSVVLEIKTDAAVIDFVGKADPDGLIRGSYTANAGSCELSGTGYLSPWEY